jgi:hypothetical protein
MENQILSMSIFLIPFVYSAASREIRFVFLRVSVVRRSYANRNAFTAFRPTLPRVMTP